MRTRKPRSDSKLKTLPEDRQLELAARLRTDSLDEVRAWLRNTLDISVSRTSLSEYWSWRKLREIWERKERTVESLLERLAARQPGITQTQIFELGQELFGALAIETQDPETWSRVQMLHLKAGEQDLARQKFQRETCELFLRWAADQRARDVAESKASNAEKIEQLRQLMFADVEKVVTE